MSNDSVYWPKAQFDVQTFFVIWMFFFIFDTKFYGPNTGWLKNYSDLIKHVPNPITRQIVSQSSFFLRALVVSSFKQDLI